MSLEWREQLSVGNDVIDSDHKYLIEIINRVEEALKKHDRQGLGNVLDHLQQYAKSHFAAEEKIGSAAGYPDIEHLHGSHEALIAELDRLKLEFTGEWTPELGEHFAALLRNWLVSHVIKEDLLLKPFLTKHSPKFDPR